MALQYGFNYLGWEGGEGSEGWKKRFQDLSEEDKSFYHNHLPWAMMSAGIGHISKETIPVLVLRLEALANPEWLLGKTHDEFTEYMQRFIGFECNVNTETDREWMERHFKPRIPVVTANDKLIEAEFDRYLAEVHNIADKKRYLRDLQTH